MPETETQVQVVDRIVTDLLRERGLNGAIRFISIMLNAAVVQGQGGDLDLNNLKIYIFALRTLTEYLEEKRR